MKISNFNALLDPDDPPPYRVENIAGKSNCLIVCDHAGKIIPKSLGSLGLEKNTPEQHRYFDPGAAQTAVRLAQLLDAPVILGNYSRLVIDLNRNPQILKNMTCPVTNTETPASVSAEIDGVSIPANAGLSPQKRQNRVAEIFDPYHEEVASLLATRENPVLISVHSFAPAIGEHTRPWDIGIMWHGDPHLPRLMIETLQKNRPDLNIGDNQPYSLQSEYDRKWNYTTCVHAEEKNIPYLLIEYNQSRVTKPEEALKMAEITGECLKSVLAKSGLL